MKLKKLLTYLLILSMLLGNASFVFAEGENGDAILSENPVTISSGGYIKEHQNIELPERFSEDYIPNNKTGETDNPDYYLPTYRSQYITSIKNQNPYGTCWTFGSMATAEAYLIKSGATVDGVTYGTENKNLDLSELQLAFNCYNDRWDPLGNIIGDSVAVIDQNKGDGTSPLHSGGNYKLATQALLSWMGSTSESNMPYSDASGLLKYEQDVPYYNEQNKYETQNTYIEKSRDSIAHLQNFYVIPFNSVTTENATIANQAIKDAIVDYGAVAISYTHADYLRKTEDTTYEASTKKYNGYDCYVIANNETGAFYNPSDRTDLCFGEGGHAVTFVGWDDDYPASNFGVTPPGNGAWIMKNSWGESYGDHGYYYVSYYETSLQEYDYSGHHYHEEAYALLFESADNYDYNYQYDSVGGGYYYPFTSNRTIGATYEVKDSEKQILEAVGIEVDTPDVEYSVQVYDKKGKALLKNPSTGTDEPVTGKTFFAGYTTIKIPLEKQPILTKGSEDTGEFTVEISLAKEGGMDVPIEMSYDYGGWARITCNTTNDLTYYASYSPNSMTSSYSRYYGNEDNEQEYTFHIKAYTSKAEYPTYVCGTSITAQNASNVLGDGTVSYTPATETTDAVLKLKNAELTNVADYAIKTTEPLIVEIEGDCAIEATSNNYSTLIDINNAVEEEDGHMVIRGVGDNGATLTIARDNNAGVFGIAGPDTHNQNVNNSILAIENLSLDIRGSIIGIGANELTIKNSNVYAKGTIRAKTAMTIDNSTVIANTTIENPSSEYKKTLETAGTLTIVNGSEIYAGGVNNDYVAISANQISLTSDVNYKFLGSTAALTYDKVEEARSELQFNNKKYCVYNSATSQYDLTAATVHIFPVQKAAFDNGKLKWAGYLEEGSMAVVASYINDQFVNAVLSSKVSATGYKMFEFLLSEYGANAKLMFVNAQNYKPIYRAINLK